MRLAVTSANATGPDHVHGLDAAADCEVEHQREQADGQRFHIGNGEARHRGINAKRLQERAEEPDRAIKNGT